jgi:NADH:ubiquinone oxidoreductase subunit 3 (subunit A)
MFLDPWRVYFNEMTEEGVAGFFNIVAAVFFIISAVIGYFIYRRKQQIVKPFNR